MVVWSSVLSRCYSDLTVWLKNRELQITIELAWSLTGFLNNTVLVLCISMLTVVAPCLDIVWNEEAFQVIPK